jgi:hypothetical protein
MDRTDSPELDLDKFILRFKQRFISDGKTVWDLNPEIELIISALRKSQERAKEAEELFLEPRRLY